MRAVDTLRRGAWYIAVILCVVLLFGLVVGLLWSSKAPNASEPVPSVDRVNLAGLGAGLGLGVGSLEPPALLGESARQSSAVFVTGLERLPDSLQGTTPDGELQWDAGGNLVITREVRYVLDYFLSAYGEEPLPVIQARILAYMQAQLPATAHEQAAQVLADYMSLQSQLAGLGEVDPISEPDANHEAVQAVAAYLQRRTALRQAVLSPEVADAFYGEEEQYDQYSLQVMAIMNDAALSADEKHLNILRLRSELPPAIQQSLTRSQQVVALNEGGAAFGGSAPEAIDPMAADRLAQLEARQAHWQQRLNDWLPMREALLANDQLAYPDRLALVEHVRQAHFVGAELRRVQALERSYDARP